MKRRRVTRRQKFYTCPALPGLYGNLQNGPGISRKPDLFGESIVLLLLVQDSLLEYDHLGPELGILGGQLLVLGAQVRAHLMGHGPPPPPPLLASETNKQICIL